jgi:hypothetical protein
MSFEPGADAFGRRPYCAPPFSCSDSIENLASLLAVAVPVAVFASATLGG